MAAYKLFGNVIGYSLGLYPNNLSGGNAYGNLYTVLSSGTPQLTIPSQQSILLTCDSCLNKTTNTSTILMITPNVTYGSNIIVTPTFPIWCSMQDVSTNVLTFKFLDLNNGPNIIIQDSAVAISVIIQDK